ncbi:unnamed protein product, partial [Dibothriocephalus latus]
MMTKTLPAQTAQRLGFEQHEYRPVSFSRSVLTASPGITSNLHPTLQDNRLEGFGVATAATQPSLKELALSTATTTAAA